MTKIIRRLSVLADTWFCIYCSASFDSHLELEAHLATCGYKR